MTDIVSSQPKEVLPAITNLNIKTRGPWQDAGRRFLRNKASIVGLVIVLFFMLVTALASVVAPHSPLQLHGGKSFLPPSWVENSATNKAGLQEFPLGTDTLGRDVLSRVMYGSRVSMIIGFVPTLIIVLVGTLVGMIAGYYGGRWDNFLMRLTDIMYGFPDLLFFIIALIALRDTWIGELMSGYSCCFLRWRSLTG